MKSGLVRTVLALALAAASSPTIAQTSAVGMIAAADPVDGERTFLRCKACHTANKGGRHRLGPNLWDIVGREKARVPGFKFSAALKKLGGKWDYASLDAYLADPRKAAPGTRMAFSGLKNRAQRAAVIAYLRTLSDAPEPLPAGATTAAVAPSSDHPAEEEDFGGLPPGAGREQVHAICGACHSLRLVTQQGLDADRWDMLMDWMTEKQGMPELDREDRKLIVGYLSRFYGPDRKAGSAANPMAPAMPMMPSMPLMPPPPEMPAAPSGSR